MQDALLWLILVQVQLLSEQAEVLRMIEEWNRRTRFARWWHTWRKDFEWYRASENHRRLRRIRFQTDHHYHLLTQGNLVPREVSGQLVSMMGVASVVVSDRALELQDRSGRGQGGLTPEELRELELIRAAYFQYRELVKGLCSIGIQSPG